MRAGGRDTAGSKPRYGLVACIAVIAIFIGRVMVDLLSLECGQCSLSLSGGKKTKTKIAKF